MNPEKLKQLKLKASTQIGGKGTPRRKTKPVHHTSAVDEKKLAATLKKVGVQSAGTFELVTMVKKDSTALQFKNAAVSVSQSANTFVVHGEPVTKTLMEVIPDILGGMGAESIPGLQNLLSQVSQGATAAPVAGEDEDAPELVVNFEEAAKTE